MRILLDMDGVVADFIYGAAKLLNIKINPWPKPGAFDICNVFDIDPWNLKYNIAMEGEFFWRNLPKTNEADFLIKNLPGEITFITCPMNGCGCYEGKIQWLRKHYNPDNVIFTQNKELCALPDTILIDDSEIDCTRFGKSILFPRPWNKNYMITNPLDYVFEELHAALK